VSSVERDPQALLERVLAAPDDAGRDLCGEVTTREAYVVPARGSGASASPASTSGSSG
jgi:carbamoyl-phosphate synthase small subunit